MEADTHAMAADGPAGRGLCGSCRAPLPSTPADFCPLCGHTIAQALLERVVRETPAAHVLERAAPGAASTPARSSIRRYAGGAAVLLGGAIAVLFIAANAGGSSADAGATATPSLRKTPTRLAAVASLTEAPTATVAVSPTVRPTATPTPVLPTPVMAGIPRIALPALSPTREIVDAVNRSTAAYSAAMARLDESLLDSAFTGDALAYYTAKIHDLRAASASSVPALLDIQLGSLELGADAALVTTRERWRMRTTASGCAIEGYTVSYTLVPQGSLWLVSQSAFLETSTGACP